MPVSIEKVITFVDQHYATIRGIEDVEGAFAVSHHTLWKLWVKEVGIPFAQYLRHRRVEQARWLLEHTELPPKQVCHHVGWKREDTGRRAFREATNVTMREYRKRVREEPRPGDESH